MVGSRHTIYYMVLAAEATHSMRRVLPHPIQKLFMGRFPFMRSFHMHTYELHLPWCHGRNEVVGVVTRGCAMLLVTSLNFAQKKLT